MDLPRLVIELGHDMIVSRAEVWLWVHSENSLFGKSNDPSGNKSLLIGDQWLGGRGEQINDVPLATRRAAIQEACGYLEWPEDCGY